MIPWDKRLRGVVLSCRRTPRVSLFNVMGTVEWNDGMEPDPPSAALDVITSKRD